MQTRPTGTMMQNQGQTGHQYMPSQAPRSQYGVAAPVGYRGSSVPVQPYAFTTTPNLNHTQSWQPQAHQNVRNYNANANAHASHGVRTYSASMTNLPMGLGQSGSRDDSAIPPARNIVPAPRPQSAYLAGTTQSFTSATPALTKSQPDRYRRPAASQQNQHGRSQSTVLPGNNAIPAAQLYNGPNPQRSAIPNRPNSFYNTVPGTTMDDMHLYPSTYSDDGKRTRRRSMHSKETADHSKPAIPPKADRQVDKDGRTLRVVSNPSPHSRNESSDSVGSSRSSHSRPSSVS